MLDRACLCALDHLLRQIVEENALNHPIQPMPNLLQSLAHSTRCLNHALPVNNAISHETILADIERLMTEPRHFWTTPHSAQLCRTLVELDSLILSIQPDCSLNDADVQQQHTDIRQAIAEFRKAQLTIDSAICSKLSHLINVLDALVATTTTDNHGAMIIQDLPPAYDDQASVNNDEKLPEYEDESEPLLASEKNEHELDRVISAVDRLSSVTPRFDNQRVSMKRRQPLAMDHHHKPLYDSIYKSAERVQQKKSGRAATMAKLLDSGRSIFHHQVFGSPPWYTYKAEIRSVYSLHPPPPSSSSFPIPMVSFQDRSLHKKQQSSIDDITDLLAKSLNRPRFNKQRFHLTADKERDLFMTNLLNKVDRLEGRRLINQDAEHKPRLRPEDEEELDFILGQLCRARLAQLDNQRAAFSPLVPS